MDISSIEKDNFNYDKNTTLIVMAKEGNKEAMNKLIEVNTPLVSSICKRFTNRGYDYEDIFQIGSMGLVKAINNFDASFNVKFSTYAVPMIIGEIKRFLRDDGIIKVSRSTKTLAKKLHYNKEELIKKLNRDPTVDELAEYSGVDVYKGSLASSKFSIPIPLSSTVILISSSQILASIITTLLSSHSYPWIIAFVTASETAVFISVNSSIVGSNWAIKADTLTLANPSFSDLAKNSNLILLSISNPPLTHF